MTHPTPESVGYHERPHRCGLCIYFESDTHRCRLIQITVTPEGGCERFIPRNHDGKGLLGLRSAAK